MSESLPPISVPPRILWADGLPSPSVTPDPTPSDIETSVPDARPPLSPDGITVSLGGDVLIWSYVAKAYQDNGVTALVDAPLAAAFRSADLRMVNLEMSFSTRGTPMPGKTYTFRGKPDHLAFLTEWLDVNLVSLANNHTLDYGQDAFLDTLKLLQDRDIGAVGAGEDLDGATAAWKAEVQGRSISFLAASWVLPAVSWHAAPDHPGILSAYDPAALLDAVKRESATSDFVIVYLHWGKERVTKPSQAQRNLAYQLIDAGADAVIGSHPHVLQGFEIYNGKPIAYSLGNFIFTTSQPATMMVKLHLTDETVWLEAFPCLLNTPLTTLVTDETKRLSALRALEALSFDVVIDSDGVVSAG